MTVKSEGSIRSVERAVAVIEAIAGSGTSGGRLTEIAQMSGLSKATAHRVLTTLTRLGWVEHEEAGASYVLGMPLVSIGMSASDRHGFNAVAAPHLNRIADFTSDTVYLTIKSGSHAVCIDRIVGNYPIRTATTGIGERRLLGTCAGSLAVLAWADADEAEHLLGSFSVAGPRISPYLPDADALPAMMRQARASGYAQFSAHDIPGIRGLAVPILGASGVAIAAFSIEATTERLAEPRRSLVVESMQREAAALGRRLHQIDTSANESSIRKLMYVGSK